MKSSSRKPVLAVPGRATSYDVARVAKVSQSAVSRCFKPGASVSSKMRARVMKAAEELGYRPNAIARSLITRRSNMVAVVISQQTHRYFPELLDELSRGFSARGIRVLLFTLEKESDIDVVLEQILQYQVDGVVEAARLSGEQVDMLEKRGVPFVFLNRSLRDRPVNAVCCDQAEGARWLVNRLVEAGHRSFGIVSGPADSVVSAERTQGALERLGELGIRQVAVVPGNYSYESGAAGLRLLESKLGRVPEAVICANDVMALGCMDAARHDLRLGVPADLSVVGFDGVGPARWKSYDLTTVQQPVRRMAEAAVSMIVERIEDPTLPPEKRTFSGILTHGSSARLRKP
ncbi:MAG: LacI family DNA-binding transcriptional regulator [Steroidobacteraceae bacterium]|jgi:DNA-binding LacI/PurR family transcriptional regulator|nr:LacI family DNA-binding transcriptional regulator [Steroidobacteraceae bacterium]